MTFKQECQFINKTIPPEITTQEEIKITNTRKNTFNLQTSTDIFYFYFLLSVQPAPPSSATPLTTTTTTTAESHGVTVELETDGKSEDVHIV